MNFRTTYFLFGAVAVLLVAFLLMMAFGPGGTADDFVLKSLHESANTPDKIAEVKKAIERLEVERLQPSGDTLIFARSGDGWKLEAPYEAKIDKDAIERAVADLIDARIDKKADITHKLEPLGLDSPSAIVTLRKGKDSYRISLGNLSTGARSVVFALVSDRGKDPVAIPKSALDSLLRSNLATAATAGEALKTVTDFRPRSLLADGSPVPWDVVQRIGLKEGDRDMVLQRAEDGGWRFVKPDGYGNADQEGDPTPLGPAAENLAGVKPLLTVVAGFRMPADAADVIENPAKFEDYGLEPGKESFQIALSNRSGGTELLLFGKTQDDKTYARLDGEKFVVRLPAKALEPVKKLLANPSVMRDRTLATIAPFSVDAIDVTLRGEKTFELRRTGTPPQWRINEAGSDASESASAPAIQQLLTRLTERRIVREFPDSAKGDVVYGLEEPAVELAIWQDGIVPEKPAAEKKDGDKKDAEKKDEKPKKPELKGKATLKLLFGKKDKDLVFVRRIAGPLSGLVAVPEGLLTLAAKPRIEYLDLTLPSFDPTKVVKLAFNRGPDKYELEKDGGNPASASWKILQPPALAGRTANAIQAEQTLTALQHLTAVKIVAAKATDAELERFGLKAPRIEAAVAVKDSAEKIVYQFGAETDDKLNLYARLAGKDRIFHVAKSSLDPLLQGEVQDLTVFRIDPKQVKSFKMIGWKDIALNPVTLDFTRKSPVEWSCKQDDKDVDSAKVERFIESLALVRADKFVSDKGPPTPEQKLDVTAGALSIELTVEGEKDPISLIVGALEKDGKTRFASSNKAPGAVFLLFKERFDDVPKPTWFKK